MSKRLPATVKRCLEKSRDSALLAIETYNKPAVTFRTGGYVILMVIAWTSLLHATLFKRKVKPYYREKNSRRFLLREEDFVYWDLSTCLEEYFRSDVENAMRKNLELFIPLRNKFEHKSIPEIDADLFAECQAMLLNYDRVMEKEFGPEYCMRESLSFSLQLFPTCNNLAEAVKANKDALKLKSFIERYRSTLSTEVLNSGQYAFKAFLMQIANHQSSEALPIQFIRYDTLTDEEKKNVERFAGLVKYKEKAVSGKDLLLPGQVVKQVQKALGDPKIERSGKQIDKFNFETHRRFRNKYKIRPGSKSPNPSDTQAEFCIYDEPSCSYRYTKRWVSFLVEKMADEAEYNSLYN